MVEPKKRKKSAVHFLLGRLPSRFKIRRVQTVKMKPELSLEGRFARGRGIRKGYPMDGGGRFILNAIPLAQRIPFPSSRD